MATGAGILLGDGIYVSMYYRTKTLMISLLFLDTITFIFRYYGIHNFNRLSGINPPRILDATIPVFGTYLGLCDVGYIVGFIPLGINGGDITGADTK